MDGFSFSGFQEKTAATNTMDDQIKKDGEEGADVAPVVAPEGDAVEAAPEDGSEAAAPAAE